MDLLRAAEQAAAKPGGWVDLGDGFALGCLIDERGVPHYTMRMSDGRCALYGVYVAPTESYEDFWRKATP